MKRSMSLVKRGCECERGHSNFLVLRLFTGLIGERGVHVGTKSSAACGFGQAVRLFGLSVGHFRENLLKSTRIRFHAKLREASQVADPRQIGLWRCWSPTPVGEDHLARCYRRPKRGQIAVMQRAGCSGSTGE